MIRNRNERGFTLIELLIVIAILSVLAALAIPNLLSSRKAARETTCIAVMREIITAQELYKARRMGGDDKYGTLVQLASTPIGSHKLISWPDAGASLRSEYEYEVVEAPTASTWCIRAKPITPGISGDMYFAASEDGMVRRSSTLPASRAEVLTMSTLQ